MAKDRDRRVAELLAYRAKWTGELLISRSLSPGAKELAGALAYHFLNTNAEDERFGFMWPGIAAIGDATGHAWRSIERQLSEIVAAGFFAVEAYNRPLARGGYYKEKRFALAFPSTAKNGETLAATAQEAGVSPKLAGPTAQGVPQKMAGPRSSSAKPRAKIGGHNQGNNQGSEPIGSATPRTREDDLQLLIAALAERPMTDFELKERFTPEAIRTAAVGSWITMKGTAPFVWTVREQPGLFQ